MVMTDQYIFLQGEMPCWISGRLMLYLRADGKTGYEKNIETVKRILKNLRAKPQSESQQWKIEQYEAMLHDLMHSAGKLREGVIH